MATHFRKILVPVDFSVNTDIAVNRALAMAPVDDCVLHLLHVQRIGARNWWRFLLQLVTGMSWGQVKAEIRRSEQRLIALKADIEAAAPGIQTEISVCCNMTVEDAIIRKALDLQADLVVLGKHSRHSYFPRLNTVAPSRVSQAAGVPVLTAKPGSAHSEVRKVVMPVSARFPSGKLSILAALRQQREIQVQLVIFADHDTESPFPRQSLLAIFKILKSQASGPVRYIVLHGENKAKALLDYSNSYEADLLLVDPGAETRVPGWANRHLSDLLPASSKTLVLAVR